MKKYPWLIFLFTLAISAGVILLALNQETEKEMLSMGLIASARVSALYFLLAFTIGPLARLTRSSWARAVMANRRYLGVGFAQLHSVHLGFIFAWVPANPGQLEMVTLVGGSTAYVLMYCQAATSNDFSTQRMGKWWKWLHNAGMYYLWFILTLTHAGSESLTGRTYTALLFAALLLKVYSTIVSQTGGDKPSQDQ